VTAQPSGTLVFKIVHASEWAEAERTGAYEGSAKDRAGGFLHFSTAGQLEETLKRYYAGADDLVLVAAKESALGAALKYEHAASRGEDFPHLYGALSVSAVAWVRPIGRDANGAAVLPSLTPK
jgi:uncharacterized protein (DUF952 family)